MIIITEHNSSFFSDKAVEMVFRKKKFTILFVALQTAYTYTQNTLMKPKWEEMGYQDLN